MSSLTLFTSHVCIFIGYGFVVTKLRRGRPKSDVTLAGYCNERRRTVAAAENSFCATRHCPTNFKRIGGPEGFERPFEETLYRWHKTAAYYGCGMSWCRPLIP